MDTITLIVVIVLSVLAIIVSLVNIVISARREIRRKEDVAWDTAKEFILKAVSEEHFRVHGDEELIALLTAFRRLQVGLLQSQRTEFSAINDDSFDKFLKEYKEHVSKMKDQTDG